MFPPGRSAIPTAGSESREWKSFIIAKINPRDAQLADFTVISSSGPNGSQWTREYTFSEWSSQPSFTPVSLHKLITEMAADPNATTKLSQDYILDWSAGAHRNQLQPIWPAYVCDMDHSHPQEFKQCVCQGPLSSKLHQTGAQ